MKKIVLLITFISLLCYSSGILASDTKIRGPEPPEVASPDPPEMRGTEKDNSSPERQQLNNMLELLLNKKLSRNSSKGNSSLQELPLDLW